MDETDRDMHATLNAFNKDCIGDPFRGLRKPKGLKHHLAGFWSRPNTEEHCLVYGVRSSYPEIV